MKKHLAILLLILSSLFLSAQEKVYMPLFEVLNLHSGYQYSASKLFKTYVDNNNKYTIILPDKTDSLYPSEKIDIIRQKAKDLNSTYFLIGELNALNEVLIVSMSLYNTESGQKVWTDMLKARTPDDLDPILQRLANSLGTPVKAAKSGDIYSVSDYESKELGKVSATSNFGIYVGGLATLYPDLNNSSSGGFGIVFSYDIRDIILNINGELYFGDVRMYDFNLTTLYPFSKKKNTPFVGAGLGYGGHSLEFEKESTSWDGSSYTYLYNENRGGLLFFVNGGYILNRTANAHLKAWGSVVIPTYKIKSTTPVGFMLNVAFLF